MRCVGTGKIHAFCAFGVEATLREEISAPRNVAYVYVFKTGGKSDQGELAEMRPIYDQHLALIAALSKDLNREFDMAPCGFCKIPAAHETAHLIRTGILIGAEIRNFDEKRLFEITDIVLNPAKIDIPYFFVSLSGVLGFGNRQTADRWGDLRPTQDNELHVLDIKAQAMREAPAVDRENFVETASPQWRQTLDEYWNGVLK